MAKKVTDCGGVKLVKIDLSKKTETKKKQNKGDKKKSA